MDISSLLASMSTGTKSFPTELHCHTGTPERLPLAHNHLVLTYLQQWAGFLLQNRACFQNTASQVHFKTPHCLWAPLLSLSCPPSQAYLDSTRNPQTTFEDSVSLGCSTKQEPTSPSSKTHELDSSSGFQDRVIPVTPYPKTLWPYLLPKAWSLSRRCSRSLHIRIQELENEHRGHALP